MAHKRVVLSLLTMLALALSSCSTGQKTLFWVDMNGSETLIQAPPGDYLYPSISPDGTKVAMSQRGPDRNIFVLDLAQGTTESLTNSFNMVNDNPIWSPNGEQIAYVLGSLTYIGIGEDSANIMLENVQGAGKQVIFTGKQGKWIYPFSWSKDGSVILTSEVGSKVNNFDIGIIMLGERPRHALLMRERYHEIQPQLSPDGRWLAYCTNESGKVQVYVSPFPDVNKGKWQVSSEGGNSPRWSPDGKELYYLKGLYSIEAVMAVEVKTEPTFSAGKPKVLFSGGKYFGPMTSNGIPYDIHPDGHRFLMMKQCE